MSTFLISNSYSVQLFLFCTARLFTGATCLQTCGTSSRTICVSGKHSILEMGKKTNSRLLHHRRINYCACLSGQSLAWHMPASCRWRIVRRRRILTARTSFSCRGITPRRRRGHARLCIVTHPLLLPGFTHAPCVRACTCGSVLKMMISAPYVFDEGISSVKPTAAVSFLF